MSLDSPTIQTPNTRLPNVLVTAYACEPNVGSEPGVAWNMIREIAKFSNVWVSVSIRHKAAIEQTISNQTQDLYRRVHWIYIDLPHWVSWIKTNIPMGTHFHYSLWQWKTYFLARSLHRAVSFDLVHHLTYGVSWIAPVISLLPAPFIWGPMGGGDSIPRAFVIRERWTVWLLESIYWILNNIVVRISPIAILARRRAKVIIFRVKDSETRFPRSPHAKRVVISETAVNDVELPSLVSKPDPFRVVCVGRMIHGKGYIYAVKAFHRYLQQGGSGKLILIGDGPQRALIQNYVLQHNLASRVLLLGRLPSNEVKMELRKSHVFLHPSFREGGSWSIIEAMEKGLPVICINRSGMADMINDSCGVRIDAATPEQLISGISSALQRLENDPPLRATMGSSACRRVADSYTWNLRGDEIMNIYMEILSTQGGISLP